MPECNCSDCQKTELTYVALAALYDSVKQENSTLRTELANQSGAVKRQREELAKLQSCQGSILKDRDRARSEVAELVRRQKDLEDQIMETAGHALGICEAVEEYVRKVGPQELGSEAVAAWQRAMNAAKEQLRKGML